MKTILFGVVLGLFLSPLSAQDEMFGLSSDEQQVVEAAASGDMFGLANPIVKSTTAIVAKPAPVKVTTRTVTRSAPYQSPLGWHRHITLDNKVIEHHDSNFGNCAAHANIARPYPKYFGPRSPSSASQLTFQVQSPCPGGVCPTNSPVRSFRPLLRGRFR